MILALAATACGGSVATVRSAPPERWGFTAPWDARSAASVAAHARELDVVVSGWIAIDTFSARPVLLYPDTVARGPLATGTRRMAIVTSFAGTAFRPDVVRRLALDGPALRRAASEVGELGRRGRYRGMVLDLEGMTPADSGVTRLVVSEMARAIRAAGAGPVVVAVPASDTAAYPARMFDGSADLLLVMLYDQHWATSPPGTIAAPDWARRALGTRVAERGAAKLVAALPLYGYQWRPNTYAATIGFDDARRLATEAGTSLARDPATLTLHASRPGADGWELWVSDAGLVDALERESLALGVRRFAYWRLGLEDPAFWMRNQP
jgi:peptidoglycan-N-acetylglucosamine deacetylase